MRLIDADALKLDIMCVYGSNPKYINWLNHAPTVDAVPVIRCKDCKHYYALNEVRGNCSEYNFAEKIPIDFCSWAERKENETD